MQIEETIKSIIDNTDVVNTDPEVPLERKIEINDDFIQDYTLGFSVENIKFQEFCETYANEQLILKPITEIFEITDTNLTVSGVLQASHAYHPENYVLCEDITIPIISNEDSISTLKLYTKNKFYSKGFIYEQKITINNINYGLFCFIPYTSMYNKLCALYRVDDYACAVFNISVLPLKDPYVIPFVNRTEIVPKDSAHYLSEDEVIYIRNTLVGSRGEKITRHRSYGMVMSSLYSLLNSTVDPAYIKKLLMIMKQISFPNLP